MKLAFAAWNLLRGRTPEAPRGCAVSTAGTCRVVLAACTALAALGHVPGLGAPQLERAYGEGPMLARGTPGSLSARFLGIGYALS